jgi:hypothetical protein
MAAVWSPGPRVHLGQRSFPGRPGSIQRGCPVALDGVLENRDQATRLLGRSPATGEQDGQEDLVSRLYRAVGPNGFKYLRGPFALALG